MTRYEDLIERKRRQYGAKFDDSDLCPAFVSAYNCQQRIKVECTYSDGSKEVKFGTVGVTTGWKPSFLLMHNRRCIGSSVLLNAKYRIVAYRSKFSRDYILA